MVFQPADRRRFETGLHGVVIGEDDVDFHFDGKFAPLHPSLALFACLCHGLIQLDSTR